MNIFKKIWYNFFSSNTLGKEANYVPEYAPDGPVPRTSINISDHTDRAICFTLYSANGGKILETRRYDSVKDREITGLYVINSDAELGEEISKIITMERLR